MSTLRPGFPRLTGVRVLLSACLIVFLSAAVDSRPGLATTAEPRPISDISLASFDTTPYLNVLLPAGQEHPPLMLPKEKRGGPVDGQADWGSWIRTILGNPSEMGVYARQEVHADLNLPSAPPDRTLYAPTIMCPNRSPLESVTMYYRYSGMSSTLRAWGVWDHSAEGWVLIKWMDAAFLSNYVRSYRWGTCFYTEIWRSAGTTYVMLYNFNTSSWETQWTGTGSSTWDLGWNMWETYFERTCPDLPGITSSRVQVYADGAWKLLTPDYGSLLSYPNCTNYRYIWKPAYYNWYVGP